MSGEGDGGRYREGRRVATTCRKCGSPCWIVYHGPRANHTIEPRTSPEQAVADAVRAEQERIVEALGYDYVDRITGDLARDVIRALPADGNTEEEG